MPRIAVFLIATVLFFHTRAFAQERGIEVQAGGGYVFDSAEGPSVPAANAGIVAWLTHGWGIGVRLAEGLTDGRAYRAADEDEDVVRRVGDLRIWALTSQWRWFAGATEVNAGVGVGSSGWRAKYTRAGVRTTNRSGVGFLALDLLVGRRIAGPVHLKGGFNWGLMDDSHPFQPVVMVAFTP